MAPPRKPVLPTKVMRFQMVVGVDLLGSKLSMNSSKNIELIRNYEANSILCYSKGTNRVIEIPLTNIKGIEYFPVGPEKDLDGN